MRLKREHDDPDLADIYGFQGWDDPEQLDDEETWQTPPPTSPNT